MASHTKAQILDLLATPAYVDEAIRLLGENQTPNELRSKSTQHHNDIGFSAAYGRTGTRMYEFVTGINTKTNQPTWAPKSLAHPTANRVFSRYINNHNLDNALALGRKVAAIHWKQLGGLLSWTPVSIQAPVNKSKEKQPPQTVVVTGAEIQTMKGKAVRVLWDSKRIWLPKSQINVNSENGDITMPKWLARNKGMLKAPPKGTPTVGGEASDDGFDWDGWNKGK
jgi:hypothetical protein